MLRLAPICTGAVAARRICKTTVAQTYTIPKAGYHWVA